MIRHKAILYADDDADDRDLLKEVFENTGLTDQVAYFNDGLHLLEWLQAAGGAELPSLILLDYNMPRMNGLETVQALRSQPAYRHIAIIIYTTGLSGALKEKVLEAGATACYQKELTPAAMLETAKRFKEIALNGEAP